MSRGDLGFLSLEDTCRTQSTETVLSFQMPQSSWDPLSHHPAVCPSRCSRAPGTPNPATLWSALPPPLDINLLEPFPVAMPGALRQVGGPAVQLTLWGPFHLLKDHKVPGSQFCHLIWQQQPHLDASWGRGAWILCSGDLTFRAFLLLCLGAHTQSSALSLMIM